MNVFKLFPVVFSALLLSAHFLHAGLFPMVVFSSAFPVLLLVKRWWAARAMQIILVAGALEWIRTLLVLVVERRIEGEPWKRLALILGAVALFTGASALVFCCRSIRERYKLGNSPGQEPDA